MSLAQGTGIFTWTKRQAGSLCYIALRRERYPNVILKALPRTQVMCRCLDLCTNKAQGFNPGTLTSPDEAPWQAPRNNVYRVDGAWIDLLQCRYNY